MGVGGTALTASERRILSSAPPFGVILFRRNIEAAEQVRELVASVRALGARLTFIDQEGGPVDRLRELAGPFPSFARAAVAGQARGAGALAGAALAALDQITGADQFSLLRMVHGESYFHGLGLPWAMLLVSVLASSALVYAGIRHFVRQDF